MMILVVVRGLLLLIMIVSCADYCDSMRYPRRQTDCTNADMSSFHSCLIVFTDMSPPNPEHHARTLAKERRNANSTQPAP